MGCLIRQTSEGLVIGGEMPKEKPVEIEKEVIIPEDPKEEPKAEPKQTKPKSTDVKKKPGRKPTKKK